MTNSEPPTAPPERESPYTARWWQASALFLVVLLVTGAAVVITTDSDTPDTDAAPGSSASATPSSSASAGAGGCPALDESDEIPRKPPAAEWGLVSTVAVPTSKTAGPALVEGDVARCYAHSPTGALIAAAQIGTRYAFADDWESVVEKQTYGDGKALLLEKRKAFEETSEPLAPVPGELGQIVGFQFITYSGDTAVLQLVHRFEVGTMQVSTVSLRWSGGDWTYEIPSVTTPQKAIDNLDGYVSWGGL